MSKKFIAIFGSILIIGVLLFTMIRIVFAAPVTFPIKNGHIEQLQPAATMQQVQPTETINQIQN